MSTHRILIVSNVRPSRTFRIAKRIAREVAGAEICGIIQRPLQALPLVEQLIASDRTKNQPFPTSLRSKANLHLQSVLKRLMDSALWGVHGSPSNTGLRQFTSDELGKECSDKGWSFLIAACLNDSSVLRFVDERKPELALLLGETTLSRELLEVPRRGWIHANQSTSQDGVKASSVVAIRIESLLENSDNTLTLAGLTLPPQPYDGLIGQTLKADLVSDDLAVQSTILVLAGNAVEAVGAAGRWMREIFSPYLAQLEATPVASVKSSAGHTRHRPPWKLGLDSLLLCSPLIVARNWYRRLRRRYPITILTHHLVSDRPHRMGISTELFLRQVRFLQRHYRIVSMAEAIKMLRFGRVESPTVVLTFDDGYADNFVSLRAVAEETGIPITMFIATQPVELQEEFQHDLMDGVRGAFPLTWQQIRYWSRGRVEFGSHTRTHFDCGSHDKAKLEWEIAGSKSDLERHLGRPVELFAFPFGHKENISSEALESAGASYRHFVFGFGGENHASGRRDAQHLLRKNLYANPWELELDLQGVFDLIENVKRKIRRGWSKSASVQPEFHTALSDAISNGGGSETQLNLT